MIVEPEGKNLIQVYGLPRSGTNFVEWTLVHNFEGFEYKNRYAKCNFPGITYHGRKAALKHSYPNLDESEYIIVIYKKKKQENAYYREVCKLDYDRVILVNWEWAVRNYEGFVDWISTKFGVRRKRKISQPMFRLDLSGANCKETKTPFYIETALQDA